jgi:hypothetical protein
MGGGRGLLGPHRGKPFLNVFLRVKLLKKKNPQIRCTKRVQIYIEVSCSNAETSFI